MIDSEHKSSMRAIYIYIALSLSLYIYIYIYIYIHCFISLNEFLYIFSSLIDLSLKCYYIKLKTEFTKLSFNFYLKNKLRYRGPKLT